MEDGSDVFLTVLSCDLQKRLRVGAEDHDRGPAVHSLRSPELELIIIDYGMVDLIPNNSLSQHMQIFLVLELCGVTSNKGDFREVLVGFLEAVHLGKHMDAVDAAAGPEVDDDEFALQLLLEGPGLVIWCVQPRDPSRDL